MDANTDRDDGGGIGTISLAVDHRCRAIKCVGFTVENVTVLFENLRMPAARGKNVDTRMTFRDQFKRLLRHCGCLITIRRHPDFRVIEGDVEVMAFLMGFAVFPHA